MNTKKKQVRYSEESRDRAVRLVEKQQKDGNSQWAAMQSISVANVPKYISTGADIVTSPEDYHIVLGNFSDLLVGFRMEPSIRVLDQSSYASNLLLDIVAVMRIDVVPLRPASFVRLEDVTTS